MRYTPDKITHLGKNEIFVFGSNILGIHGAGAAKQALYWGAVKNKGYGKAGQTYAIPTKHSPYRTLPLNEIRPHVNMFIEYAKQNRHLTFLVTMIGCGYAGYTVKDIAPLFQDALNIENVYLPKKFVEWLQNKK